MNVNDTERNSSNNDQPAALQGWEKQTLENLLFASLKEQRSWRRWRIAFKLLTFGYILVFFALLFGVFKGGSPEPVASAHTALINVNGLLTEGKVASADNVISSIKEAFKNKHTKGIILRINSPGGSPVQVSNISDEIARQRKLHPKIKVYAVCTDICASGGYWVATAADKIYANPASLVGSIGVVMEGFGFVDVMKKVGVDRRLITAGTHKGLLDSFSPLKPDEVAFAERLLGSVHQQFIHQVVSRRGDKLKITKDIFSGLAWVGQDALALGLIDAYGSEEYVAREVIHAPIVIDYTFEPNYLDRITNQFSTTFASTIIQQLTNVELH